MPEGTTPVRTNSSKSAETTAFPTAPFLHPPDSRPLFSAGFWNSDPHIASIRKTYITSLARGALLTAVTILAVLSIYWGALWKIEDGLHNFNGWIVDFDGGPMAQVIQTVAMNMTGPKTTMAWTVVSNSIFADGPSAVAQAVVDEKCWAAVVINPGVTTRLASAISAADPSYNGASAVTIYAAEARNENSYSAFIAPMVQGLMNRAAKVFATQHASQLASHPNITALLSNAPNIVTEPMSYILQNIRPFDAFATSAADFVGLIYLLIFSFLITNLNFMARMETGLARHLTLGSLIQVRIVSAFAMYFFVSLIFALLSLAFQIPFNRVFASGFVVFWMLCWVAMSAFGLALEAMITLLTPRFTPYFLILWIIPNVSICYYPIEVLPPIFQYGFGMPFYQVSRAVRTLVFSTRNQIGLNFGVEFAWVALSLITMSLFQWLRRRSEVHEWRAKRQGS